MNAISGVPSEPTHHAISIESAPRSRSTRGMVPQIVATAACGSVSISCSTRTRKAADSARQTLVEQLKRVRYFHKQAAWLTERFPDAELRNVEGLVKLVNRAELEANDWSLTPGRYVGVAPEEEDDGFDFEEALREIHVELEGLNAEAAELAARISRNFKELGI